MVVLIFFTVIIIYGIYTIWDDHVIFQDAGREQYQMYRPEEENSPSFSRLQKINPDTVAWLTIYGSPVDYPVMQGRDNKQYMNQKPDGSCAISGSLFIDAGNARDFSQFKTIIYGHHMDRERMFGGLDHFREKRYFQDHQYGNLYYQGKNHGLQFFALCQENAYNLDIYRVGDLTDREIEDFKSEVSKCAIRSRSVDIDRSDHVVILSTCAGGVTNNRLFLCAKLTDETYKDPFRDHGEKRGNIFERLPIWWYIVAAVAVTVTVIFIWRRKKNR